MFTENEIKLAHVPVYTPYHTWSRPLPNTTVRPFLTRKFFQEILGLEGSQNFLGKFRQVHNLKILDRLLRSKSFFQENIPGFICSVFRSA